MKFSKSKLKNIIQEELDSVLAENARRRALVSILMKILKTGPDSYARALAKSAKRDEFDIKKDPGAALSTLGAYATKDFTKAYRNNGCPSVEREGRPSYDKDLLKCKTLTAAREDLNNNIVLNVSDGDVKAARRLMAFIPSKSNYAKSKYMSVMTTRAYAAIYKKLKKQGAGEEDDL